MKPAGLPLILGLLTASAVIASATENPPYDASIDEHVQMLYGSDPELRISAAQALGQAKTASPEALGALRYALQADETEVRAEAAASLGHLGAPDYSAMGRLNELMTNPNEDTDVRFNAAYALAMMGSGEMDSVLAEIIRLAEVGRTEIMVSRARTALKRQGNASVAPLERSLEAKDASWSFVLNALENIGTPEAMDARERIETQTATRASTQRPSPSPSISETRSPASEKLLKPDVPEPADRPDETPQP